MIPNRFHFVFGLKRQVAPFHLAHYVCLESCLQVNRPECIYLYYHHEPHGRYWDLIKDRLVQVHVDSLPLPKPSLSSNHGVRKYLYAHQADLLRLEKLLEVGGVYADLDTIFVSPIPGRLYAQPFVLGSEGEIQDEITHELKPSLCNALIMAEPNAPFGRLWLDEMPGAMNGTWSAHSTLLPYRLSQEHPDWIHVEPARSFYKHRWTRACLHTLLEGYDPDYAGVYSMHLWAHLWWSWWRRDFSSFHAGRLTEDYVRNVDTTYNVIARKFLPPAPSKRVAP